LHSEANWETSDNGREPASTAVAFGHDTHYSTAPNAIRETETDADPNPRGKSTLICCGKPNVVGNAISYRGFTAVPMLL
jgi:hypothetical protein